MVDVIEDMVDVVLDADPENQVDMEDMRAAASVLLEAMMGQTAQVNLEDENLWEDVVEIYAKHERMGVHMIARGWLRAFASQNSIQLKGKEDE